MNSEDKNRLVDKAIAEADLLFQRGMIREPVEIFLTIIKNWPEFKKCYYACAKILLECEEYEHGFDLLEKIPDGDKNLIMLELAGYCLSGMNKITEALEYADKALFINPFSAPALNLKGELAFKIGDLKKAENVFKKVVEIDPVYPCSYTNLSLTKLRGGFKGDILGLAEKGFDLLPTVKKTVMIYHEIASELGEFKRAGEHFIKAYQRYPGNKRLIYLIIDIFTQQNKFKEAMEYIETLLARFDVDDEIIIPAQKIRDELGPVGINVGKKGKTISLCMIVRDEEKDLAKCLKSVKDLVDEIIIVDTGSTDRTIEIAKIFGAIIYEFKWNDSFSNARNFSIDRAKGDWIFVLDADEVISHVDGEHIRGLINNSMKNLSYQFTTRNYINDWGMEGWHPNDVKYQGEGAGIGWVGSDKVRLFSNDKRVRFENCVHEFVEPSLESAGIVIKKCSVPIHHYGRLNTEKILTKKEEYYHLGKIKLKENKKNPKALFELALQAIEIGRYDEALELLDKVIIINPEFAQAFFNKGYVLIKLEQYQEALKFSRKALGLNPDINEALTNCAVCEIRVGSVKKAILELESFLMNNSAHIMGYGLLALAFFIEKNVKKGVECVDVLKKHNIDFCEYFYIHAKRLVSAGRRNRAALLLKSLKEADLANSEMSVFLEEINSGNFDKNIFLKQS